MIKYNPRRNYSLDELDFQYVQLYGATFENGVINSPNPNPLFGLAMVVSVASAIAIGCNISLLTYCHHLKRCVPWISEWMISTVCYLYIAGIVLVLFPFIYNLSTGFDIFQGCYLCCQISTYLAAAFRGGLFFMSVFIVHQLCVEKDTLQPNPTFQVSIGKANERKCKLLMFCLIPVACTIILFPDISSVHDPVHDHRFHHCVVVPWDAFEISQFPLGAFAYPAFFLFYWVKLVRCFAKAGAHKTVRATVPALLIFFFYPFIYTPYLIISQYGTPNFSRNSWMPAAAFAFTFVDFVVMPPVYSAFLVHSKRQVYPESADEEATELN
ncbi:hypothetical protein L596_007268 [Steinernema carpocapsae]|uniref:Uncharacterized protein n=1 Tax=Steinernema carpocapsae TaxID=34508 RepID=A0A4V6A5Y6_STECR|nr:hypothetical protein L596_007268 [Steinernema carpocapsae]